MEHESNKNHTESTTTESSHSVSQASRFKGRWLFVAAILVALAGMTGGFLLGHTRSTKLSSENATLRNEIAALDKKTKQQEAVNKGIVSDGVAYKDPEGGLGLLNGKITFTLPKDWVRVSSSCSSFSRDSTVLCYDTAAITPKDQQGSAFPWSANISVFQYKKQDGTAKDWFEDSYLVGNLSTYDTPHPESINEDPIAGNSGLIFQLVDAPAYVNGFYVVVHGSYAVVISAQLQYGGIYGTYPGAQKYDYRKTYDPILKELIKSVKFKGN